jgi:ABC-type Fe3+/spermidine/putrescine transport system ATPase subunit
VRHPLHVHALRVAHHSRGGDFILEIADLALHAGEVLAVLGPNGSGKSTLLKALAGLQTLEAGHVACDPLGLVTMVFQRPVAFAGTVDHNIRIALRARGLPAREIDDRCASALAHFGIAGLARRRASRLSGGELRRLALARAFSLQPSVLLLDEPFDDLDPAAQEALSLDLRRAVANTGVAVAVVTHDLRRAALVCDRVAVLYDGALRQIGLRDDVLTHPADPDVAQLVGMSNWLPAVMLADGLVEIDAEHRIPSRCALEQGAPVWLGVRPEHVKVDIGRGDGEPIGKGRVLQHVSDGMLTTLVVEWGDHELRTHLVAGRGLARELRPGDVVSLSVRCEDVHVIAREPSG